MKNPFRKRSETVIVNLNEHGLPPTPKQIDTGDSRPSPQTVDYKTAFDTMIPSRILRVRYEQHWTRPSIIHIIDEGSGEEVFGAEVRGRRPHLRIFNISKSVEVATVRLREMHPLEITMADGQLITVTPDNFFRKSWLYDSVARDGEKMDWKPRKKRDHRIMVLLNGTGVAMARYTPKLWSRETGGLLELAEECLRDDKLFEEIVVVALTVVHRKEVNGSNAAAAGGAAGGAAAC